jgi:PAS domain S-box-containing protein
MPAPDSYYSPEDMERSRAFMQQVLKEGTGTIELELICKNGRKVPTEYRVSVIKDEQGEPKYIISIGRYITERSMRRRCCGKTKNGTAHLWRIFLELHTAVV